jgi:hypothetical protein
MSALIAPVTPILALSAEALFTPPQDLGAFGKRRIAKTTNYCEKNGLQLVDLCLKPKCSAFPKRHRNENRVELLIDACRSGMIKPGTALIVDSQIIPSRPPITKCLLQLLDLINNHRLEIHTPSDQQIYKGDNLDLGDLLRSIVASQ